MGKTKDLGHLAHIVTYDSGNNITLPANLTVNGTITGYATTASLSSYATQSYVSTQISNLVASAPATLDTLNELATALGNDPNFATTIATSIGTKVPSTRTITINGTAYDLSADRSWNITSMIYPAAGIPLSTGTAWGASITNNSANWNTAYGWGNHATAGYLTGITSTQVTNALGYTPYNGTTNPNGYITGVTNITGYAAMLNTSDTRTISPSSHTAYRLTFGFTSWSNNNTADWADYLHLRSYGDGSGGADNLVMFKKNGIGMRIWQQAFGSGTAYSSYVDVIHSGNYTSYAVPTTRTITINGTAYDLSANREWTVSGTDSTKMPLSGGTFTGLVTFNFNNTDAVEWPRVRFGAYATGWDEGIIKASSAEGVFGRYGMGIHFDSARAFGIYTSGWTKVMGFKSDEVRSFVNLTVNGNAVLHAGNYSSYNNFSDISIIGSAHKYLTINPGNGYEAMVRYIGGSGSSWYVGKRTTSQLVGTESFHFYSEAAARTVAGIDTSGNFISYGNIYMGGSSSYAFGTSYWAGAGGYPGYQFSGGNTRFGFSSTSGAVDVYTDGNFYAGIDYNGSNNLVWHAGNMNAPNRSGTSYYQVDTWLQCNGYHGLYAPSWNNAHFYPNDLSYGSWRILGSRNGWTGLHFGGGNGITLMMNEGEFGFHREGVGWVGRFTSGRYYGTSDNTTSISSAVGGSYTWTGIQYFLTNNGTSAVNNSNTAALQAYSTGNNTAFMSFHRAGYYAVNFGLDADNWMRIGGWSAAANRWQLNTVSGDMVVNGDVTAFSDERVKENIETIDNALEKVLSLRGVFYTRNDQDDKKRKVGVIAQETLPILPEVVNTDPSGMYNVAYGNMGGLFIEAFKEQQKKIEAQGEIIEELKRIINGLTK